MINLLIAIAAVGALTYFWYASIISKHNKALEALSGIDVQLKQRFDLIPNVLKVAQKFMTHEKSLLTEITELRTQVISTYSANTPQALQQHIEASNALSGKLGQLMVSVENYPDLKSNQTMVQAMQTYNEVEGQLSAARRFYNASVTQLNNAVSIFPGNYIARIAKVSALPFFEADKAEKANVNADQYLQ